MAESANADDIFLLYNEKEEDIDPIAQTLKSAGLSVYFYRRDLPVGSDIQAVESEKLRSARAVVVLLGKHGWGPTQREIAFQAESLQKIIVPVLIDEPPADALTDVDGMFQRRRRIDFRERAVIGHVELALEIQNLLDPADEAKSPRYDDIFKTLFDGSEADRLELLNWIIANGFRDAQTLADKLVDAIVGDFSPTRQNPFEASIRDPNRLPAARSWMLSVLLWLRVEDDNHTKVILDHVDHANENDRAVRFWTLAGIIQTDRSCRAAAIEQALDDPSPEVAGLARVARDPSDDAVLNDLRVALASDRFETVWWVLRVLRIFPVPSLAADVVNQLGRTADGRSLAYDALFALSSASMRNAARPHILQNMGLTALARIVVVESRNSTPISLDAFARVLSAFERGEATQALETAAEDAEDRRLVGRLIDRIEAHQAAVTETDPRLPGHAPDIIDIGKDDIGIRRDVQTLTSVMLSREVEPPLAIGLFGEWGSGKSFYIKSLEAEVKAISNRPAGGPYCTRVAQINFNAWHYVDTNLWASLVSHILESLAVYLKPSKTPEEQRAALASELASAKEGVAIATEEQKLAAELLKTSTAELQQKVFEREHSEVRLRDLRAQDLSDILKDDKALAETLHGAFDMVGAPALLESASELERAIRDVYSTTGKAKAFFVSIFTGRNALIVLLGMLIVLGLPPLAFALRAHIGDYVANASAVLGTITAIFGSAAMVLKTAVTKFKTGLEALSSAKSKIDARLADKRAVVSAEEKRLQEQVADALAQEAAASGRVEAAATRVREIEERLTALKDSQSLGYFITERTKSDDYRRHLGLIATIRKDFDGLVERIQNEADGVDRIVLYIDDVDRCPPEMVVEILQAVHLLLAYKLFVVIVSVDPRWLQIAWLEHSTDAVRK
ncbi:TIR domain-containing protein [Ensifer sp. ENS09]|uniref:toll/interleukin-1 receptor domain-containing protein n=1 Tax=Ensifer sp. ENS09 TaxID=2769263 RepID=UPI0017834708|nr:toll/interleukin-1 receptor domain-containing protein [Ensifer sp. ENS09]MBD9650044.1 TIR domain-containing protein [Ensifer sp. ENS09]